MTPQPKLPWKSPAEPVIHPGDTPSRGDWDCRSATPGLASAPGPRGDHMKRWIFVIRHGETHMGNSWKIMEHHLLIVLEVYWWARRVFCITFFLNEVCKSWADEAWSAANHSGPVRSCSTGNIAMANLRYPVFSLAWLVYIIYVNPHLWQNISKY